MKKNKMVFKPLRKPSRKETEEKILQIMLFNANNQDFVNRLSAEERQQLINIMRKSIPDECVCCVFYVAESNGCTLGTEDAMRNGRPDDCALNEKGRP